jgi:hypothetical protein
VALTKISAGVIAANAVVDSFGTQSITGDKIGLTAINANNIVNSSITGAKLAANTVTGDVIGQSAISSNNILSGTITTTQIASNTVSNTNIATGAVENYLNAAGLGFAMRNRIINGAMMIDQRNAGASVTGNNFVVDRFKTDTNGATATLTGQQSTTVPSSGFKNSLSYTATTTDTSLGTTKYYAFYHKVEGLNCADLNFGSASAATVTLSFWVRSSLTGTFCVALRNSGASRSYVSTYIINAANTWEQKTITVPGDTSGTWLTTNGTGIETIFTLASGTTFQTTANAWQAGEFLCTSGQTNFMGTSGATFFITGVQLEKGFTATSFDYRPYTTELLLCQRYFVKFGGEASAEVVAPSGMGAGTTSGQFFNLYPVRMRAIPTVAFNALTLADTVNSAVTVTSIAFGTNVGSSQISAVTMNVASGVAANRPLYARTSGTDGFLSYSAEL